MAGHLGVNGRGREESVRVAPLGREEEEELGGMRERK